MLPIRAVLDPLHLWQDFKQDFHLTGSLYQVCELRLMKQLQRANLILEEREAILDWLSTMNHAIIQQNCRSKWQKGTGEWILETNEFRQWVSGQHRRLWCRGQRK
jgi:hypothetical protein